MSKRDLILKPMFKLLSLKFLLIVIFLIALIGLGITLAYPGIFDTKLTEILKFKPVSSPLLSSNPVSSEPVSLTLNLSHPEDNNLVFDEDLLIEGKSSKDTLVLISLEDRDQIIETDTEGNFSQTVKLIEGVNHLSVSAFDQLGNLKSEERTIYYSKEKI